MAKQQGNKPTAEEQRQPVAQEQGDELDLLSGRAIIDSATGVYVAIRVSGKVQRKLKSFANERGVRIQDLVATAIREVYGGIIE